MTPRRREPTRLADIRPELGGPAGRLLAARRRWRGMVGPELARTLPLLACAGRRWIIGLPSEAWEAVLREAAGRVADDPRAPELVGRLLPPRAAFPEPGAAGEAAPPTGTPREKLADLQRRLEARRRGPGES